MGKCFFILCLCFSSFFPNHVIAGDSLKVKKTLKNPFEYKKGRFQMAFFPVSSYDPASGIEFGAMPVFTISPKKQPDSTDFYRSSSLATHLTYSTKNWANIRSEGQFYTSNGFNFVVFFQYLNAPDYFYGIGSDTINKNPSKFQNRYMKFSLEFSKCKNKVHFWGFKTDVQLQHIDDIQLNVLNPQISGYDGGIFLGIGPLYKFDSRNDVNFPSKGYLIQTSITQTVEVRDLRHSFATYNFDIRKYILFLKTFILAAQVNFSHTSGDVPFFKLSTIGGKYNLRGISNKNKYIDKNAWYTQAEIRKMILPRIGFVTFAGVGNVFDYRNNDEFTKVKTIFGLGGRLQLLSGDKINLRFDYAFGPNNDSGFYATIREAF